MQDGVPFPALMGKVAQWKEGNISRLSKMAVEHLGALIAEVASKRMVEAEGKTFTVRKGDVPGGDNERLFKMLPARQLKESEALNDFASYFGYTFTSYTGGTAGVWMYTEFKPA